MAKSKKKAKGKRYCQPVNNVVDICTKNPLHPGLKKGVKTATRKVDTSTMNYVDRCSAGENQKVPTHYRCPPELSTNKVAIVSGGKIVPICKGKIKPYKVPGYTRKLAKKGGCGYANPR